MTDLEAWTVLKGAKPDDSSQIAAKTQKAAKKKIAQVGDSKKKRAQQAIANIKQPDQPSYFDILIMLGQVCAGNLTLPNSIVDAASAAEHIILKFAFEKSVKLKDTKYDDLSAISVALIAAYGKDLPSPPE